MQDGRKQSEAFYTFLWHFFHVAFFKLTATVGIGIHPIKASFSQLGISKMQSGREDTLEE